jgi:hypothetical protein
MTDKVFIGGAPLFENPFSDCLFLGRMGSYDLYLTQTPGKPVDVLARSGAEPGEYVEGLKKAWGINKALTAARRIAEYKKLLPMDPVKALLYAHEPEDLASIRKALVSTQEYAVLTAYRDGDSAQVTAILQELADAEALVVKYPESRRERALHVDMNLYLVGGFMGDAFARHIYANALAELLAT